ncbi:hypothetical protein F4778DRAFT_73807 [Xylariomycetidae sp. FL2044]|nr:hypothetical protein F4778DRAFT_73807 [Xylariomycetidae sp. FL2044]
MDTSVNATPLIVAIVVSVVAVILALTVILLLALYWTRIWQRIRPTSWDEPPSERAWPRRGAAAADDSSVFTTEKGRVSPVSSFTSSPITSPRASRTSTDPMLMKH